MHPEASELLIENLAVSPPAQPVPLDARLYDRRMRRQRVKGRVLVDRANATADWVKLHRLGDGVSPTRLLLLARPSDGNRPGNARKHSCTAVELEKLAHALAVPLALRLRIDPGPVIRERVESRRDQDVLLRHE